MRIRKMPNAVLRLSTTVAMQGFDAEVLLRNDEGTEAEANSVIALLMLDSAKGRQIEVEATGPQEVEALAAVIALFNSGFDED